MRKNKKVNPISIIRIISKNSGMSLLEVMVLLIVLIIFIAIGYYFYHNSVTQAKIIIAENTLKNAKENLENYYKIKKKYPDSIDFTNCTDEDGDVVFYSSFCKQMKNNFYSIESYARDINTGYELLALAKDADKTLFSLTAEGINVVVVKQDKKHEF